MFEKVIVFESFEMIKKKKNNSEDRVPGPRLGQVRWRGPSQV